MLSFRVLVQYYNINKDRFIAMNETKIFLANVQSLYLADLHGPFLRTISHARRHITIIQYMQYYTINRWKKEIQIKKNHLLMKHSLTPKGCRRGIEPA